MGIVLAIPLLLVGLMLQFDAHAAGRLKKAVFFLSPSCHSCIEVKENLLPQIEKDFAGRIAFEYRDLSVMEDYRLLVDLRAKFSMPHTFKVPLVFFEGAFLEGKPELENGLRLMFEAALAMSAGTVSEIPAAPSNADAAAPAGLVERFKAFTPAAVAAAGLIDGINPCAFTVIVFFVSFLALQGYRRRELVAIGLGFIVAVCATYLAIGLGLFNFLYRLKGFWFVAQSVNFIVGSLSIVLAVICIADITRFRKTGSTDALSLQLPAAIKRRIHDVIGFFYRRTDAGRQEQERKPCAAILFGSALVTGFLVSVLEAVCTGQVYLPTIVFVMKSTELKARALHYLIMYNVMFIMPLCAVFVLALAGTGSGQFAAFFRRRIIAVKLLLALVFFSMGLMLLIRIG